MLRQFAVFLAAAVLAAAQELDGFDAFANPALRDWKRDGLAFDGIDGRTIA